MENIFATRVEEQDLPEASFTDLAVLFASVALAAGVDIPSMKDDAERAVGQAHTFFQELLAENARSDIAEVQLLSKHNDAIAEFLQTWLEPHVAMEPILPVTSWREPLSKAQVIQKAPVCKGGSFTTSGVVHELAACAIATL